MNAPCLPTGTPRQKRREGGGGGAAVLTSTCEGFRAIDAACSIQVVLKLARVRCVLERSFHLEGADLLEGSLELLEPGEGRSPKQRAACSGHAGMPLYSRGSVCGPRLLCNGQKQTKTLRQNCHKILCVFSFFYTDSLPYLGRISHTCCFSENVTALQSALEPPRSPLGLSLRAREAGNLCAAARGG